MSLSHASTSMAPPRAGSVRSASADRFGPGVAPLRLFGLEFSLDTASLDALEEVARLITKRRLHEGFNDIPSTEEIALLTTCHRVELLFLARSLAALEMWREILPGDRNSWRLREGREVVHHLFRVASGRESLAVGEGEVRHQVRAAGGSVESRHPRSVLRHLLEAAAGAADELFPEVLPSRSIAFVASSRLLDLLPSPSPTVLVIGSGTIGRQVAEHLAPRAQVTIVYHRNPPDETFLSTTGARAVRLDQLGPELAGCDAIVTAAKFGNRGLHASDLPRDRPIALVDLGVPRNIDPEARRLPNVRLVDLQDLHSTPAGSKTEGDEDVRVAEIADRFSEQVERLLLEPWIDAIRRAAEALRRAELSRAKPFLGPLNPSQEAAIERLTQRLVAQLLLAPTERIRSFPPGPEGDLQRRLAFALLRPPASDL